ncbi:MAG TPA: hypothetical protein VFG68_01285 [Fimbriiglobus sp.]|nr:hypothetical protein [Fimbriiglobus sp.]
MTELTEAVERAVRPVWASRARKRRMRQELLTHLTTAFEEERARLGDDRLALNQALARFGDPVELTRELQAAVPRWERVLFARYGSERFGRRFKEAFCGTGAAPRRDAVLLAGLLAGLTLAMLILLPLIEVAGGRDWSAAFVPWDVMAVLIGHAFVSGLLCVGYIRAVGRTGTASVVRAAAWGAAVVLWGAALVPALAVAKPDDPLWAGLMRSPGRTATAAAGSWVFLVILAVVSRYIDAREKRAAGDALAAAE